MTNRASNLHQGLLCPGHVWAEKSLPERTNPYAEEGTLMHKLDAQWDGVSEMEGLDEERMQTLTINRLLRQNFIVSVRNTCLIPKDAPVREFREQEFHLCDESGIPVQSHGQLVTGHPDLVMYFPEERIAIIFDSKFGRVEVTAAWINLQLRCYFVSFAENYECDRVFVAITQPWVGHPNNFHCAEYNFARDHLDYKREAIQIIRNTESPEAPRHASKEACSFCRAVEYCRPAFDAGIEGAATPIDSVTPEELERLADKVALMKNVCEKWTERMKRIAADFPEQLTSYELGNQSFTRSIPNPLEAFLVLSKEGILNRFKQVATDDQMADLIRFGEQEPAKFYGAIAAFLSQANPSVPKLEEALYEPSKEADKKYTKKAATNELATLLGSLIKESPMDRRLVRKKASLENSKPSEGSNAST